MCSWSWYTHICVILCVFKGLEEVSRTEIGKKIKEGMEEAAKTAKTSAETVSKSGEMLGKTGAFKAISQVCSHWIFLPLLKVKHESLFISLIKRVWRIRNKLSVTVFLPATRDFLFLGNGECEERDRRLGSHWPLSASRQTQKEDRVLLQGVGGRQQGLRSQWVRECLLLALMLRREMPLSFSDGQYHSFGVIVPILLDIRSETHSKLKTTSADNHIW